MVRPFKNRFLFNLGMILVILLSRITGHKTYVFQSRHAFKRIWAVDILRLSTRLCLMKTYTDRRMASRRIAPSVLFLHSLGCKKTLQEVSHIDHLIFTDRYNYEVIPNYKGNASRDVCYISQVTENFMRGYSWDEASSWAQRNHKLLIEAVSELSFETDLRISVLMRPHATLKDSSDEMKYFQSMSDRLQIIEHDKSTTYSSLGDHKLIVCAHSTLGIDAFRAKYPVSFFGDSDCPSYDLGNHGIDLNICQSKSQIKHVILSLLASQSK